ncbi:hypothetical protein [Sphingobium boeckii]|uniref:Uncharacterized protein n=1 Tax=Sphingobium boeckii TaxID=1082345 RepID=A0A7W9AL32_9SPHN|nr:hypothetical protein [Sphingobium boeckii]MBB5687674.1 hypothetical protein [Sphingobium boeckii]
MLTLFLTPEYAIFSASFLIMIGIGLIEAVGLGISHFDLAADFDGGSDAGIAEAPGVLDWLGLKTGVPRIGYR